MKTFSGWREAGHAMRWARQRRGAHLGIRVRYFPLPNDHKYVVHTWTDGVDRSLTVGHDPTNGSDLTVVAGDYRRDLMPVTVAEALAILAELDLIPATLAADAA